MKGKRQKARTDPVACLKLLHAVIELEERADQDQAVGCAFDQLFQVVIGAGCREKFRHFFVHR